MSELTRFRDYCRRLADEGPLEERALWVQLADEITAYLGGPEKAYDLFGQASVEPTREETL